MTSVTVSNAVDTFMQAADAAAMRAAIFAGIPNITRKIHVDKSGNDTTGTGSSILPYLTVNKALAVIIAAADNTEANPYIVQVGPGTYDEDIAVMPWVWIVGDGVLGGPTGDPALFHTLSVAGSTNLDSALSWHSSWGDANYQRGGLAGLYLVQDSSMGNMPVGSDGAIFDCFNVGAHNITMTMRGVQGGWNYIGGFINDPHITNGYSNFLNVHITIVLTVTGDDFGGTTTMNCIGCNIKKLSVNSTGGGTTLVNVSGCKTETADIDGSTASILYDVVSFPRTSNPNLTNSGSYTLSSKALALGYTATTSGDWASTPPTTVQAALDRLAAVALTPP